jgi:hypothetical protein
LGRVLGDVTGKAAKNVIKDIQTAFKSNTYFSKLSDDLDYKLAGSSKDAELSGDMNNVASNGESVVTTNEPGMVSETPEMNTLGTTPTTPETYNGNKGGFVRKKK